MKKENSIQVAFHTLFWVAVLWIFAHYSYLRPIDPQHVQYEYISAVFLMAAVYIGWFVLIPKLFEKARFLLFWIASSAVVAASALLEICLIYSYLFDTYTAVGVPSVKLSILSVFTLVFLRNAAFYAFFFILRIYEFVCKSLINKEKALSRKRSQLIVSMPDNAEIFISVDDMDYITCNRNLTFIHLSDGQIFRQYKSLSHWETVISEDACVRINAKTLVILSKIDSYNCSQVTLRPNADNERPTFPISDRMRDEVIRHLEEEQENFSYKRVPETVEEMPKRTFSEKVGGINLLKEQVKEKISENPGANVAKLLDEIPDTSQRSIERILRQLKEDGSIEYRGSRKTGGYYAVEKEG